jgi:hypothetical protein
MKKIILFFSVVAFSFFSFGQNDSVTAKERELLKLFGGIIKNVTGEALKENGLGKSKSGLVGGAIKNILTKTAEKSIMQLGVPGGFRNNPGAMIQLPDQLKKLEGNFQQFGKKQLLDNLLQSMNETASDALSGLAPIVAGKMADMAVDRIITNANAGDSTLTQSFDRLFRNDLRLEVLPLVEKGLKTYRTARMLGKIKKLMKKKKLGAPDFDLNDHVTTKTIDGLLGLMKKEELTLRNNPAGLLEKLFNLIKD